MDTLLVAVLSFVGFIVAYRTYGRWLGRRIFALDASALTPSREINDGSDFVPTRKSVIFGHHFTSIAGTGPIVGPAIAVFWGWLPALLWVVFGSIFIGAVHDFGALVVSMRSGGRSIGDIAGDVISPRARILLLAVLLLELTMVLAVFGLVIAVIFNVYPESVLSVWVSLPLAVILGLWVYKKKGGLLVPSLLALAVIYLMIWVGTNYPFEIMYWVRTAMGQVGLEGFESPYLNTVVVWTVVLFVYCFIASVLPVWLLLQPRDYVNSNQLFLALGLVVVGLCVAGASGGANLLGSAPAVAAASEIPADAPPILPFLFITIACGAVSGFHSLVSSGTSSKQISSESDAQLVGYGSMLAEAVLAVVVILACCAGVGMGLLDRKPAPTGGGYEYVTRVDAEGRPITGRAAWRDIYHLKQADDSDTGRSVHVGWSDMSLSKKIEGFIEGGANFLGSIGIPPKFAVGMLAVLVACFAATTLDTATRLQRYVIQELARTVHVRPLANKYLATGLAVLLGATVAIFAGAAPGKGGLMLWPMFGATNQLLAGLGFLVIAFFLFRRGKPIWFLIAPAAMMLVVPAWAMCWKMFNHDNGWAVQGKWLLLAFGATMQLLTAWLIVEAVLAWRKARQRARAEAVR